MYSRKHLLRGLAVLATLTGLGLALAQEPKSVPVPEPTEAARADQDSSKPVAATQPPAATGTKEPRSDSPEELETRLKRLQESLKPGEQQVIVDVMGVQVPAGFLEESGLRTGVPKVDKLSPVFSTALSRRELKMLEALVRTVPGRQVFARPTLVIPDGRTSSFQTSGPVEEIVTFAPTTSNGRTTFTPQKVRLIGSHFGMKVSASVIKEGSAVNLEVDLEHASLNEGLGVTTTKEGAGPSASVRSRDPGMSTAEVRLTCVLPPGEAFLLGWEPAPTQERAEKAEVVWVLTAHVARGK